MVGYAGAMNVLVAAFYHFAPVDDPESVRASLRAACEAGQVRGTILVAHEGLNGTIAGPEQATRDVIETMRSVQGFESMRVKEAFANAVPFARLKVKVKPEIVTFRQPSADPTQRVGAYVDATDWNDLVTRPDVTLIDCRNGFEVEMGTFTGSVDPGTTSFTEFANWVRENPSLDRSEPIAMFCTGGIRCEKATAFMLEEGFTEVYHLHGGILAYLDAVPRDESLWRGECFVFDERISVGHER